MVLKVNEYLRLIVFSFVLLSCGSGIDLGNPPPLPAASSNGSTVIAPKKIFVSTGIASGNFQGIGAGVNGIAGADAICQTQVAGTGITTAKAMLVDGTVRIACTTADCSGGAGEHTDWVLAADTPYTRVDGTVIGTTTSNAIFTFNLTNSIGTIGATWTGLNTDWTANGNDCTDWTDATAGSNGRIGMSTSATSTTLSSSSIACNIAGRRIYCVEQ